MDAYEKGCILGTGTFGQVFKATHKQTGKVVAVKKINIGDTKEGINVTALREIKILRELHHPHVVALLDAFPIKRNIGLVFECMESDLEAVIKDKSIVLSAADSKSYMQMFLMGLGACHKHWIVHRDVKPNNCLIASNGVLKLADFGLSRTLGSPDRNRPYTNQVFARWYRPPELFFGSTCYGFAIDVWAAGCLFAELLLRRPWMPGESDIDQLGKIFQMLGTPNEDNWPGVTKLPCYLEFHTVQPPPLKALFPRTSEDALDLLSKMMALNPARRWTVEQLLQHRYFTNDPAPTPPERLPRPAPRESNPINENPRIPVLRIHRAPGYPGDDAGEEKDANRLMKRRHTGSVSPGA